MVDCSKCKHLIKHPATAYGFTCVAYEHYPDMVIYIPGISELGCDLFEPKQEASE